MRAVSDKKRSKHSHKRERYGDTKERSSKDKYWIQVQHQQKPHGKTAEEFRQCIQIFRNDSFAEQAADKKSHLDEKYSQLLESLKHESL